MSDIPTQEKGTVVTQVSKMIRDAMEKGTIHLPSDYSADNALKAAWLVLQETKDKAKRPVLQVCSQISVINALFSMVIEGLSAAKDQGYFIAYGETLVWQRSYFGEQALVKRLWPGIDIYASAVYKDDEFEMAKVRGRTVIDLHKTKLENQDINKLRAFYCGVYLIETGEDLGCEVMTLAQVQDSWSMSQTYRPDGTGPHNKFPDQMGMRTVIRRRCKPLINTSTDAALLEAIRRNDALILEAQASADIGDKANQETLEIRPLTPKAESVTDFPTMPKEEEKVPVTVAAESNGQMSLQTEEGPGY